MISLPPYPIVMGILNCTPDSFFEGSRKQTEREIAERADEIMLQGGAIIDIGACSTRPGAERVSEGEEMRRLHEALRVVRREHPKAALSVDTYRPAVARMAVEEYGADIINDISEGEVMAEAMRLRVPYILMSQAPDTKSIIESFATKVQEMHEGGLDDVILDPGLGFGKDVIEGNYRVLNQLPQIKEAFPDKPLLVGLSRKRMIWQLLGCSPESDEALQGTMMAHMTALERGADILRVHDVKETMNAIAIHKAVHSS